MQNSRFKNVIISISFFFHMMVTMMIHCLIQNGCVRILEITNVKSNSSESYIFILMYFIFFERYRPLCSVLTYPEGLYYGVLLLHLIKKNFI